MAAAEIYHYHHHQMRDEPDIVVSHILVDIDKYQDARNKNTEQDIGEEWNGIVRVPILKEVYE